jgi:hypothetical protein
VVSREEAVASFPHRKYRVVAADLTMIRVIGTEDFFGGWAGDNPKCGGRMAATRLRPI